MPPCRCSKRQGAAECTRCGDDLHLRTLEANDDVIVRAEQLRTAVSGMPWMAREQSATIGAAHALRLPHAAEGHRRRRDQARRGALIFCVEGIQHVLLLLAALRARLLNVSRPGGT